MRRLALLALLAAGCGTTSGARWDEVQGSVWILQKIEGAPSLAGAEVSLTLDVGRLYGSAVNRYSAQYERTGDALRIDTVAATKRFLDRPPGAMAQEARYLDLLGQVDGWSYDGGWLDLKRKGETILAFKLRESTSRS